jgi:hypothetical protein
MLVSSSQPSQRDLAHRQLRAPRFNVDIAMRRSLHCGDQHFAGEIALETAELLG